MHTTPTPTHEHFSTWPPSLHVLRMRFAQYFTGCVGAHDLQFTCMIFRLRSPPSCTDIGLDNSGQKAGSVACLLKHRNVGSQPGPSTSKLPPLNANNEDRSRLLNDTLREMIRSGDDLCHSRRTELAATVQLNEHHDSTSDLSGNLAPPPPPTPRLTHRRYCADQRSTNPPTSTLSMSVSLPTASVPSRAADRIL